MRPEDISDADYCTIANACEAAGAEGVYDRLADYVLDLERYADTLEEQLSLESRQPTAEPGNIKDDLGHLRLQVEAGALRVKELEGSVSALTSELAGAQARLFAINLLTR